VVTWTQKYCQRESKKWCRRTLKLNNNQSFIEKKNIRHLQINYFAAAICPQVLEKWKSSKL
jgi:hypothetical protein